MSSLSPLSLKSAEGYSWTSRVPTQAPRVWSFTAEYTQLVVSGRLEPAVGSCVEVCGQLECDGFAHLLLL